ncbi:glycoside hydrolase family 32 protein [Sinomonas atrocyanea]
MAIYTSAYAEDSRYRGIQAQSLAYSLDGGETWSKHEANPVLDRSSLHFRDPKVFRYTGPTGSYWVMVAVEAVERKAVLYRSDDLRHWTHLSDFEARTKVGEIWECPDLFPLAVDGNPADVKWVLVVSLGRVHGEGGSASVYFVGDFDGLAFTSTPAGAGAAEYGWLDSGRDYYAAVSFDSAPDGRRIMIGWMNNWDYARVLPTSPWRGSMALPREIVLRDDNGLPLLVQRPVPGLLPAGKPLRLDLRDVPEGSHRLPVEWDGTPCLIEATFDAGVAAEFGLVLRHGVDRGTRLGYDVGRGEILLDRTESGQVDFHPSFPSVERARVALVGNRLRLQVYIDAASVEVFAQDGRATFAEQVFPHCESTGLSLYAVGGTAQLLGLTATPLEPTPVVRERQRVRAI